jgi:predicted transposase
MKLTLQLELLPDKDQAAKLKFTIGRFNSARAWLAMRAFEIRTANKITLQQKFYYELREKFGLAAQMASICIRQVGGTYGRDKRILPDFGSIDSMPYDNRVLSFKGIDRVSILTLDGRISLPFMMGKYHFERFSDAKGQSDLVRRKDGKWFLLVTVDLPDGTSLPSTDFDGVNFDVVNPASEGSEGRKAR